MLCFFYSFMAHSLRILIFALSLAFLYCCSEEEQLPQKAVESKEIIQPEIVGNQVTVTFVDSSHTKAVLKADRARVFSEHKKTYLDGNVKTDFFSAKTKERISWLSSDSAEIDDSSKDMLAKGNVVLVSDSNKTRLETSILFWDNKTQKLYSTEFVKIKSPQESISGWGFESDINLNNYRIFKVSGIQK